MNTFRKTGLDKAIIVSLAGLIIILPIAHITTIRAFFGLLPLFFLGIKIYRDGKLEIARTPLEIPLLFFLATIVISLFTSLNFKYSLRTLEGEFLKCALLFYVVFINATSEEDVLSIAKALIFGSFLFAVYGIFDFFMNSSAFLDMSYRAGSLELGYDSYAQYLIMVLPVNIMGLFYLKSWKGKFFLFVVFALNCFELYLTRTRGAWVAFMLELLLIAMILPRKNAVRLACAGVIIVILSLALSVLPQNLVWHGNKELNVSSPGAETEMNTAETRLVIWKEVFKEISKNPLKGAGYGKAIFKEKFKGKEFMKRKEISWLDHAHNTFVDIAIQLGVQGVLALLLIIFVILKMSWATFTAGATDFDRKFGLAAFVMTIGFFTANQVAEFYIDDLALLFWFLTGMLASAYRRSTAAAAVSHG